MHALFCLLLLTAGVEQADDAEVPPVPAPRPAPDPPALPTVPVPPPPRGTVPAPPPGWRYHLVEGAPAHPRRWDLFAAGVVTFAGAWSMTLMGGLLSREVYLDLPLVGPLLETTRMGHVAPIAGLMDLLLVTDTLAQLGGLVMAIAGPATRKTTTAAPRLELVPAGAGVALRGAF